MCVHHAGCLTTPAECAADSTGPTDRTRLTDVLLRIEHTASHRALHPDPGRHFPTARPPSTPTTAALSRLADEPVLAEDRPTPAHRLLLHAERLDSALRELIVSAT
ncbi:hypothetical protein ACFZBU_11325 [Embleya sp. NPDC008237]|uniref:hypothetical protein n=1 Tax=Embleya sp. NPDC008237 TaxID=3363978 RepID=UPI0036E389DF